MSLTSLCKTYLYDDGDFHDFFISFPQYLSHTWFRWTQEGIGSWKWPLHPRRLRRSNTNSDHSRLRPPGTACLCIHSHIHTWSQMWDKVCYLLYVCGWLHYKHLPNAYAWTVSTNASSLTWNHWQHPHMYLHSDRGRCSTHQRQPHNCRQWSPEDMCRSTHPPNLYKHLRFGTGWKHTHLFPTRNVDLDVNDKEIPWNPLSTALEFKSIQFNVLYYIWQYMQVKRCDRGADLWIHLDSYMWSDSLHPHRLLHSDMEKSCIRSPLLHTASLPETKQTHKHKDIWNNMILGTINKQPIHYYFYYNSCCHVFY